jgi:hypothetical protein
MATKVCKYCGESFILLPNKPGYANECPECLHEKTRPQPPADVVARFLKQYPERRRHLTALRKYLSQLGLNEAQVEEVVSSGLSRILKTA